LSRRSDELRPALTEWLRASDEAAQEAVLGEHPDLATVHGLAALDGLIMDSGGGVADQLLRRREVLERRVGARNDRVEDRLRGILGADSVRIRPTGPNSGSFTVDDG
jgi:hypothetical protein